ncbi:hypothetical protein HYY75_07995 [bacterium]|nr:hypothetical protein [bacterium]
MSTAERVELNEIPSGQVRFQDEWKPGCGIVFIIFIILLFQGPRLFYHFSSRKFSSGPSNYRQKNCYSNLRILMGAIEMYNMDYNDCIYFDGRSVPVKLLLGGGYLNSNLPPRCPISGMQYFLKSDSGNGNNTRALNEPIQPTGTETVGVVTCPTCGSP